MRKFTCFVCLWIFLFPSLIQAQQNYIDFEGVKFLSFGYSSGMLDTLIANPAPDAVNPSVFCARYVRDTILYDNAKLYPFEKLVNVSPYLNNTFQTPKIRMKVYSTAPPGTRIELQLGIKSDNTYPTGVHSLFITVTTMQNTWEYLTFHYNDRPEGGASSPNAIDKIALFFHPNSSQRDTFYFDELSGPELATMNLPSPESPFPLRVFQNVPNPSKDVTYIRFQLYAQSHISLKLYDLIGNEIMTVADDEFKPGMHTLPVETSNISEGIYFYIIKTDGYSRSMKMIVSK